jgi:hypothetical protein
MWRLLAPGLCTWLAIAIPATVAAGEDIILVLPLDGPAARKLDGVVVAAIPTGLAKVPVPVAARADQLLRERDPTTGEDEAYAIVAHRLQAAAVIEGVVSRADEWHLRLSMRRGDDGTAMGGATWSGANEVALAAAIRREVPAWVNTMLAQMRTRAPGIPTEPPPISVQPVSPRRPAARVRSPARDPFEDPLRERPQPTWELSVGPRVLARTFKYSQNMAGLPGYSLVGAAAIGGELTIYPVTDSTSPMRSLGINGAGLTTVGAKIRTGGIARDTSVRSFRLGPRYRVQREALVFTGGADFGQDSAEIDAPDETPPNVRYTFLRPSIDGRWEVNPRLSLGLTLAYLHVLSLGPMGSADRFPHDTVLGAEVGAAVGYAVDDNLEVRLCVDLRHFAHAMNFQAGDPYVVGGALDEHVGLALLVAYRSR